MQDILVHVTELQRWAPCVHYAARLAGALHASLTGAWCEATAVAANAQDVGALVALAAIESRTDEREVQAAAARFRAWAASLGAHNPEWQAVEADPAIALRNLSRWHDLSVLGRGSDSPWNSESALAEILMNTQAPCLIVPDSSPADFQIHRAAIAWKDSLGAIAAVHDALPLLRLAHHVVILSSAPISAPSRLPGGMDVSRYLARHGIHAVEVLFQAQASGVGADVLQAARDADADLLVMGAFGRSRLAEWALGGVSRHLLAHSPIPMLMRH